MFNYNFTKLVHIISGVLSHTNAPKENASQMQGNLPNLFSNKASFLMWVIVYAGFIFFLFILPNKTRKKKELEIKKMYESISIGTGVLVTGGLYGKVVDIYTDLYIVEFGLNKSIRIPINKSDIVQIKEPDLTTSQQKEKDTVVINETEKNKTEKNETEKNNVKDEKKESTEK